MDFTQKIYQELFETLLSKGYSFQTFEDFFQKPKDRVVVLRHYVDLLPQNALDLAVIEHGLGIKARNYYRIVNKSNVLKLIMVVRDLRLESYHYDGLTLAKGEKQKAINWWKKRGKSYMTILIT